MDPGATGIVFAQAAALAGVIASAHGSSSVRREGSANEADCGDSPSRSAGAASATVCSVPNVARSSGVAKVLRRLRSSSATTIPARIRTTANARRRAAVEPKTSPIDSPSARGSARGPI